MENKNKSIQMYGMKNALQRITLLFVCVLGFLFGTISQGFGQTTFIDSVSSTTVYTGQTLTVYGTDIYDGVGSDILSFIGSNTISYDPLTHMAFYTGTVPTQINFTIPETLPCGNYNLEVFTAGGGGPSTNTIAITVLDSVRISLSDSVYCIGEQGGIPTVDPSLKTIGNTFSSTVSGLVLDSQTGQIGVHSGSIGINQPLIVTTSGDPSCRDTDTVFVTVKDFVPYTLSYPAASFCAQSDPSVLPDSVPSAPGLFKPSPLTLGFNDNVTGDIDVEGSPAGTYNVTYVPNADLCFDSSFFAVTIQPFDSLVFSYQAEYCPGEGFAAPIFPQGPAPAGEFRATAFAPIVFDSTNGVIDLDASSPTPLLMQFFPSSGCGVMTFQTVTIRDLPDASFYFNSNPLCGSQIITPVINTPPMTHTFLDLDNRFFNLDPNTGGILPDSSTLGGPYPLYLIVDDGVCTDTGVTYVDIVNTSNLSISYPGLNYCQSGSISPVVLSGTLLGDFLGGAPGQLAMDSATGTIDLENSRPGVYDIWYVQNFGGCIDSILVADDLEIDSLYLAEMQFQDSLCEGGGNYPVTILTDPTATPTLFAYTQDSLVVGGIAGGTDVNVNNIPITGPHSVQLVVTNGACSDTTVEFFRILPAADPSFEYVPFEYCQDGNFPYPNIIGDPGGLFTSDSLIFATGTGSSILGEVNLAASPTGIHEIIYEVGGPLCPETDTFQINIIPSNEAQFAYDGNLFCTSDSIILPLGTYTLGGFSATTLAVWDSLLNPASVFLPINDTTGMIDIPNAIPGEYQIRHDLGTGGVCQFSFTLIITIFETAQGVTLTYPVDSLCPNVANPVPTLTGDFSPGSFASTPNVAYAGPDGEINLAATDSGTHVINYVTEGECPLVVRDTIYIEELLSAEFDYGSPTNLGFYCTSEDSASPFYVLNPGGTFWAINRFSDPIGFIDPQTGVFDLSLVTTNDESPYTIFYSPPSACKDTAQDIIQISLGPDSTGFFVTPGDTICEGEEATFFAFGGNSFTFYRDSVPIPKDSLDGETFRILDSLDTGEQISVAIQNSASCVARDTIEMTVITKPVLNLIQTPRTISSGQNSTLVFTSSVNGTFFDWVASSVGRVEFVPSEDTEGPALAWVEEDLVTTVILEDETSPAQIFFTITPWIQVTPMLTCTGSPLSDTVLVNPEDEAIFIPEIITPNGDIFNETWQIQWREDIEASDYTMYLFNRSGGQLMAMTPLNALWDGDDNPDGVYWWKLVNNRTGQTERTGGLTIIRRER